MKNDHHVTAWTPTFYRRMGDVDSATVVAATANLVE